jgi:GcrA cell cycle regulator
MLPAILRDGAGKKSAWTVERVDLLKKRQVELRSASQIGIELGVSRNAVIGKLHRLGLRPMSLPKKTRTARAPGLNFHRLERAKHAAGHEARAEREKHAAELRAMFAAVEVTELAPEESACAVTLMDAKQHHCRWPLGDPRDMQSLRFCGANKYEKYSYCKRHCLMAYRDPPERQR